MKLTKNLRDIFINKVINALPNIDYISQTQEYLNKQAYNALPDSLKNKEISHYLEVNSLYIHNYSCLGRFKVRNSQYELNDIDREKVKEFHSLFEAQRDKKYEIKKQLEAVIYGCFTLKKAKEILPEDLHKYLPVENERTVNSMAVTTTSLMDSLKELGFKS